MTWLTMVAKALKNSANLICQLLQANYEQPSKHEQAESAEEEKVTMVAKASKPI